MGRKAGVLCKCNGHKKVPFYTYNLFAELRTAAISGPLRVLYVNWNRIASLKSFP